MRKLMLVLVVAAFTSCGGGDSPSVPTTPTPTPTPVPTPTPTPTLPTSTASVTLDAPSDYILSSGSLGQLLVGKSLYVALRPLQINQVAGERYAHSALLWLFQTENHQTGDSFTIGTAVSFNWASGSEWNVQSYLPGDHLTDAGRRVQMGLGEQKWVLISRRTEREAEFFFEGTSLLTLPIPSDACYVYGCVLGTKTEFTYAAPATLLLRPHPAVVDPPLPCGDCAARTER